VARKVTAEHLAAIKEELGFNKNTQFINKTRGRKVKRYKSGKKKKKHYINLIEDEKAFLKFCVKHLDSYIYFHYHHYISDDNKKQFRENILHLVNMPSYIEIAENIEFREKVSEEKDKAFKRYMKKEDPQTLEEYNEAERKFAKKQNKLIKKYRKKGFVYSDNIFVKRDLSDFADKLIKRHEDIKDENKALRKCIKNDDMLNLENAPDHIKNIEKRLKDVEKKIKKSTKRLQNGVTQTDLQRGLYY